MNILQHPVVLVDQQFLSIFITVSNFVHRRNKNNIYHSLLSRAHWRMHGFDSFISGQLVYYYNNWRYSHRFFFGLFFRDIIPDYRELY